nr:M24 family metallopeptidase C-terminal domain-containing protein [Lachnospiraceae bacterium]
NSHGIRIENEILCVEDEKNEWGTFYRFETLTLVPLEKGAIVTSMLTEKEKQWIDAYHKMVYERISSYLTEEEKDWLKQATAPL